MIKEMEKQNRNTRRYQSWPARLANSSSLNRTWPISAGSVEAALGAEIDEHLGSTSMIPRGVSGNSRNGYSSKTLKGDHQIDTPRDRSGTFESQLVDPVR